MQPYQYNLPGMRVKINSAGQARIQQCNPDRNYLPVIILLIAFTFALSYVIPFVSTQYTQYVTWFHDNYRPTQKLVTAVELVTDSQLEERAVNWIHKRQRVVVSSDQAHKIVREVFSQSLKYNVDPFTIMGLIAVESGFDNKAISPAGALGLTQVIPKWHTDKLDNPIHAFDPQVSIRVGVQVLAEYLKWHNGNMKQALRQYNGSLNLPFFGYDTKVLKARSDFITYVNRNL